MRLALHTDYSLRVLMYLSGCDSRATVLEISNFYGISRDHVAKVVQRLARLGYIRSLRGVGGGVELAKSANKIRIGEVISDIEGNVHLLECVGSEENICVIQPGCKLRGVLAEAERIQMQYLNKVKLSDVVKKGQSLVSLTIPTQ
ncbi:MAG: Rrf2 family nitric oxide-sensitive transcriptional repressor [Pirellulaceae bacterium]|jgi:Rrf2 family nitric oxide-sensitive transcriptional repressor